MWNDIIIKILQQVKIRFIFRKLRCNSKKGEIPLKCRPILVDNTLQELTEHGDNSFAMSMDEQHVNKKDCGSILHWHYEVQISLVTKGSVLFKTQERDFLLHTGEGIFFNSGCLHEALPADNRDSIYVCINFHPKIIYGYPDSLLKQAYVDTVLCSNDLQVIPLTSEPWHKEACRLMRELARTNTDEEFGYEVRMYSYVLAIWHLVIKNNANSLSELASVTFAERQRIKNLTKFIHNHYMDAISLESIAESDHISKGECCRVFKRVLGVTPFEYLVKYRIKQSMKMLAMTSLNISEIAQSVGFGSGSYFTECFKRGMHCAPNVYRKRALSNQSEEQKPS